MQPLYAYLLKLSFCLATGYFFYHVLLRRMTYYNWNRYYLLLFPLFAAVIPVLPFYGGEQLSAWQVSFFVTGHTAAVPGTDTEIITPSFDLSAMLLKLFIAGSLFFLARFIIRLYALRQTCRSAVLLSGGAIRIYQLPGTKSPFSFSNGIYLDTALYSEEELQSIIAHEKVHVIQQHTTDMIIGELVCIIQWFNPFAWMLKHAIRQNLEFIADEQVLQEGINRKGYQYLLLKVSGALPQSVANNFLFPSLKKRIQMMNRTRTAKRHLLKFICLVPIGCLLLLAFSGPPPRTGGPVVMSKEQFSLSSLSFYISDATVASIIKKEQGKSLLKPGGPLSLALISEEKARLTALLARNGYNNMNANAISFVMDTSATSKSFSVRVTIQTNSRRPSVNTQHAPPVVSDADNTIMETYPRYSRRVDEEEREPAALKSGR